VQALLPIVIIAASVGFFRLIVEHITNSGIPSALRASKEISLYLAFTGESGGRQFLSPRRTAVILPTSWDDTSPMCRHLFHRSHHPNKT
jgi:hypothetical protein